MKRIAVFMALLLSLMFFLSACEPKKTEESNVEVGKQMLVPHLGERDLNGYTLRILSSQDGEVYSKEQFSPENQTGEIVNDAIIIRNQKIEQEYNCKIENTLIANYTNFPDRIRTDIMSGTVEYDFISTAIMSMAALPIDGYLNDLRTLPNSHLKLDESWWDPVSGKQLTLGNKAFFACGDALLLDDGATCLIFFNKDLVTQNNLESPYDLVKNNKWTIDKMHEMAKAVAKDAGDGSMDVTSGDTWGFVGASYDCYKLILGCSSPMVTKDENDLPIISMTNPRNLESFAEANEFITDKSCVAYVEQYYRWDAKDAHNVGDHFISGKALFKSAYLREVNSTGMRNANIHYGIIPLPKMNEQQQNYSSMVCPYSFYVLSVPNYKNIDFDKATFVMEAMAYLGKQDVTPTFFDVTLKTKRFEDNDSPEMLDIIMSNRVIDLAVVYNWNDCIQYYNRIVSEGSNNVVSFMEANQTPMQAAMDETIEALKTVN